MGRQAKAGLSKHPTKGYRISIGKRPDGEGYRTFWLGKDRAVAEFHVDQLKGYYETHMEPAGRAVWTDGDLRVVNDAVREFRAALGLLLRKQVSDVARAQQQAALVESAFPTEAPAPAPAQAPGAPKSGPRLHQMIDKYVEWFCAKGDRSPSSKTRIRETLGAAKKAHADIPMERTVSRSSSAHLSSTLSSRTTVPVVASAK